MMMVMVMVMVIMIVMVMIHDDDDDDDDNDDAGESTIAAGNASEIILPTPARITPSAKGLA